MGFHVIVLTMLSSVTLQPCLQHGLGFGAPGLGSTFRIYGPGLRVPSLVPGV